MRPSFLILLCKSLEMQLFAVDASQSVFFSQLNFQNRRLNGHMFKIFSSSSLIACGLHCNRNPRCASINFKATETSGKGGELNGRGVAWPADERNMVQEEGGIFRTNALRYVNFEIGNHTTRARHVKVDASIQKLQAIIIIIFLLHFINYRSDNYLQQ